MLRCCQSEAQERRHGGRGCSAVVAFGSTNEGSWQDGRWGRLLDDNTTTICINNSTLTFTFVVQ